MKHVESSVGEKRPSRPGGLTVRMEEEAPAKRRHTRLHEVRIELASKGASIVTHHRRGKGEHSYPMQEPQKHVFADRKSLLAHLAHHLGQSEETGETTAETTADNEADE